MGSSPAVKCFRNVQIVQWDFTTLITALFRIFACLLEWQSLPFLMALEVKERNGMQRDSKD